MYEFPIKHFEQNLIFNERQNECWALFKMKGYNYDYRSKESKINILNSMARFLANIGKEAAIWIVPTGQDIGKHYRRLIKNLSNDDKMYKQAKAHAEQTEAYLKELSNNKGNADDYKVYIATKLTLSGSVIKSIKDALNYLVKEPIQAIEEYMQIGHRDIYIKKIEMFLKLSDDYFRKQGRRVALERCTAADVEWMIRRVFYRGLPHSDITLRSSDEQDWTPYTETVVSNGMYAKRTSGKEILQLTEGLISLDEKRTIKVQHESGTSYQTFATIAHIPDGIPYPGSEWLFCLQDFPMQTETIIRINTVEHKESIRNVEKKKKEIKDQMEHIVESDDELPDELVYSKEYANELQGELKATRAPISNASITFCLYADNKEELEANYDFIKETYTDNNFIIERPLTDQFKLFMESIPGAPRYVDDYVQPLPPRTLAGSVIGATRIIGDNVGPYIGTTGPLKKPVYLDISRATKLNRSASGGFYGTLGGGKSFSANLLFYITVLYGARGLVIDPKGERSNWMDDLPEFSGEINISTLSSSDEDRGKLDPFIIYKDNLDDAQYLALSILSELFDINQKDDEYTAILVAINWVKDQEKPCMLKLIDRLNNMQDDELCDVAKKVGRKMELLSHMSMAKLLFGTGDEEGLNFNKRINVIQIQNLNMPKPDSPKDEYTQDELLSTVLMLPIASFARKFIHQDRRFFKNVLFDEAWALESTSAGKQMMNALIREGRALNAGCFFISQGTSDVKEDSVKTNISYKFCFKAKENREVKNVLEFLDLEITEENIETVKNLENGECLFQDLDGRVGILKFDAVFEHLIDRAFNTNPDKLNKEGGTNEVKAS